MILIVIGLILIIGFMVADAILDWIFIAVYALLATAALNSFVHLFKYHRKYARIDGADVGHIFLYLFIAAIVVILQVSFL